MTEPTDANTLNRVYWRAVAESEREAIAARSQRAIGDGHTDGLRAVDRAAVRRTLDELQGWTWDAELTGRARLAFGDKIREMRGTDD